MLPYSSPEAPPPPPVYDPYIAVPAPRNRGKQCAEAAALVIATLVLVGGAVTAIVGGIDLAGHCNMKATAAVARAVPSPIGIADGYRVQCERHRGDLLRALGL
jgi:hypothetical protein